MNKIYLVLLGLIFFCESSVLAQEASPDTTITPDLHTYTSLEAALKEPEKVFRLSLKKKGLGIFPPEIAKLKNLRVLDLSRNKIKFIPPEIGSLVNLEKLNLSSNKLELIPAEIGKLEKLKVLSLNRNEIEALPAEVGNLTSLEVLELWDNSVTSFPEEAKNLGRLKVLEMRGIMINEEDQEKIREMFPETTIFFSPACNCKY